MLTTMTRPEKVWPCLTLTSLGTNLSLTHFIPVTLAPVSFQNLPSSFPVDALCSLPETIFPDIFLILVPFYPTFSVTSNYLERAFLTTFSLLFSDTEFCLYKTLLRSDHSPANIHFSLIIILGCQGKKHTLPINFPTEFRTEKSTRDTREKEIPVSPLVVMILGNLLSCEVTCDW